MRSYPFSVVYCIGLVVGLLWFHGELLAQTKVGPFEVTGFYRYTVNPATGKANPNNVGLMKNAGKPYLNLMSQSLDLNIYGKFGENWSVNFEPRFLVDMTKAADFHHSQYESLPLGFSGSGNMLRVGGNDFKFELSQAYANYRKGNNWVRVGKQAIAWGETVGLRVLDVVNPLDLSQSFFFDRAQEEFEKIRVPQWFFRGSHTFPNNTMPDLTAELVFNPGLVSPTILPEQGAPYNVVPNQVPSGGAAPFEFRVKEDVKQGEPTAGMRVTGTFSDIQFSVNYLTKPNDDAIGLSDSFRTTCFAPPFTPPCQIGLLGKHPRINIIGGSLNYFWQSAGALLRFETTVTPDHPFTNDASATKIVERGVWKSVINISRPTYIIPGLDSMDIGFQYFLTYTGGGLVYTNGAKIDTAVHTFSSLIRQPLFRKQVYLEFLVLYDTDDAHWLQPGIHWEVGNHVRLNVFYNKFGGSEKRAGRFGAFDFADGAFIRFTYGF